MSVGPTEIVLVILVMLLLFGGSRIASLGKGLGEGIHNFKKGLSGDPDDAKRTEAKKEPPKSLPPGDQH